MTQHFNGLTEAEQERLAVLAEECGEAVQVVMKILRHGYESDNHGKLPRTNRQDLERELGHIFHAISMLTRFGDLDADLIGSHANAKADNIKPYLHHQTALG